MRTDSHSPDYAGVTERQRATWASGDFNAIARKTLPMSEALIDALDPRPGQRVLDIACGSGNAALIAARRECEVAGVDYVPALIERARLRAQAEGTDIDFRIADAQALPFADGSFDVVLSAIGVMFAPDQEKAASELLRVCRPAGRIGLASWLPEAFGGDFFAAHGRHVPPPEGMKPPSRWGTPAGLEALLGQAVVDMKSERRSFLGYFRSVADAVAFHCTYFGPTIRALQVLDAHGQERLRADLKAVFDRYNRAKDGTAVIEYEYLQTLAIRA